MKKTIALVAALMLSLGIHKGQLALLKTGSSEPLQIYPLQVRLLPPADQLKLAQGIEIRDSLHLAQLLEDYLS